MDELAKINKQWTTTPKESTNQQKETNEPWTIQLKGKKRKMGDLAKRNK